MFNTGMDSEYAAKFFLKECLDPDFTIQDGLSTLKSFDKDFKAKVSSILKYQLKTPAFEYTLFTARGLACYAYIVEMAESGSNRADVFHNRLAAFHEKLARCNISPDLMEACLANYYEHLDNNCQIFWTRGFNWDRYYKENFQYDNLVHENEIKTSEKKSNKPQPKKEKQIPVNTARKMTRKKFILRLLTSQRDWMTVNEIQTFGPAEVSSVSEKTILRYCNELVEDGLVVRKKWYKEIAAVRRQNIMCSRQDNESLKSRFLSPGFIL
jgi:hypothetical protein